MDVISDFFVFFIQILFWVLVFNIVFGAVGYYLQAKAEDSKAQRDVILKKFDEIVHIVKVEQHNDTYYWFDNNNNMFLGQGKSEDECIAHVKERFPTHMFFFADHTVVKAPTWKFEQVALSNE